MKADASSAARAGQRSHHSDNAVTLSNQPPSTLAAPAVTTNGGRIELRLQQELSDGTVEYDARIFLGRDQPENLWLAHFVRQPDGTLLVSSKDTRPIPDWVMKYAKTLLQLAARSSEQKGWPRRLTRWRKGPDE